MATAKKPLSMKVILQSVLQEQETLKEEAIKQGKIDRFNEMKEFAGRQKLIEQSQGLARTNARIASFTESTKEALLSECIYKVFSESVKDSITNQPYNQTIMRILTSNFIRENGPDAILSKMRKGSIMLSEMSNLVYKHLKKITESIDRDQVETFEITKDMKDDFFDELENIDSESVSAEITRRVEEEMQEFIQNNVSDRDRIKDALERTQAKIEEIKDKDDVSEEDEEEITESYKILGQRKVNEIRSEKKGIMHSIVNAVCESVLKDTKYQGEFMQEGRLNMQKIVDRCNIVYTFMETLNTARFAKVTDELIAETIASF